MQKVMASDKIFVFLFFFQPPLPLPISFWLTPFHFGILSFTSVPEKSKVEVRCVKPALLLLIERNYVLFKTKLKFYFLSNLVSHLILFMFENFGIFKDLEGIGWHMKSRPSREL